MQHSRYSLVALLLTLLVAKASHGQLLRYDLKQGQSASYEYDIQVDHATSIMKLSGIVRYQVTLANDQHVRLLFEGGLRESSNPHPQRAPDVGIPLSRTNVVPAFFNRTNFPGKSHTRSPINLTRTGQVLTLDASSQLPYLLGNLSLIPFEVLPETDKKNWRTDSGVSISEGSNATRNLPRAFGPAFPSSDRLQIASEVTSYNILGTEAGVVCVEKTYDLKTPETGDREVLTLNGKGQWNFDTTDNLPLSSDMQYQLSIKDGNTTTTIPIKLKFTKLSKERLVAIQEEAKANQERMEKMFAEQKAIAAAPIVGEELDKLISDIESNDKHKIIIATSKLIHKEMSQADPRLVEAIRKLTTSDEAIASLADNILRKIDPVHKINKLYEESGYVESTELSVDGNTELFVGQIIQIAENGQVWYPAEITELLSDGKVATRYRGWGKRRAIVSRNQMQLAPKEVVQPKRVDKKSPASSTPSPNANASLNANAVRTWSDSSGTFKVEASYLGLIEDKIVLKTADGREIQVPISRLSLADKKFIDQLQEELRKLGNPFEK